MNSITALTPFSINSNQTFSSWAGKFNDFVQAFGSKWTEAEKIGRLKLYLEGTARNHLEELEPDKKDTLQNAMTNLAKIIDSPFKRDAARTALSACKQQPDETITQFLERLIPLAEAAYSMHNSKDRKERLCETFLDRMNPEISFLMKLSGSHRDFETARNKAIEVETMLAFKQKDRQLWALNGSKQNNDFQQQQNNLQNEFDPFLSNNQTQFNADWPGSNRSTFPQNSQTNNSNLNPPQEFNDEYFCTHCGRGSFNNNNSSTGENSGQNKDNQIWQNQECDFDVQNGHSLSPMDMQQIANLVAQKIKAEWQIPHNRK